MKNLKRNDPVGFFIIEKHVEICEKKMLEFVRQVIVKKKSHKISSGMC